MSTLYREYISSKAVVTDSEAQEYFEKDSKRIRKGFEQYSIDHKERKRGIPFEKVASKRFPRLPKDMKAPWDNWVIELVDKKVDPQIAFASERGKIAEILQKHKSDELHETMLRRMRANPNIVFPQ
jgi:hypothetical protein